MLTKRTVPLALRHLSAHKPGTGGMEHLNTGCWVHSRGVHCLADTAHEEQFHNESDLNARRAFEQRFPAEAPASSLARLSAGSLWAVSRAGDRT